MEKRKKLHPVLNKKPSLDKLYLHVGHLPSGLFNSALLQPSPGGHVSRTPKITKGQNKLIQIFKFRSHRLAGN